MLVLFGRRGHFSASSTPVPTWSTLNASGVYRSCTDLPSKGQIGTIMTLFCRQHDQYDVVEVRVMRCMHDSRETRACFNTDGVTTPAYFKIHADDGIANVMGKHCSHDSCTTHLYRHVSSKRRKCTLSCMWRTAWSTFRGIFFFHDYYTKRPYYNVNGKEALYFKLHAENGMVDVQSIGCSRETCTGRPYLNVEAQKATYCKLHGEGSG